ncbi:hypothetical protein TNCV_1133391 [Trichonephila clavipes]|nr:hypothetical protein TNCV_1133391 [Trichonephila clavipes]
MSPGKLKRGFSSRLIGATSLLLPVYSEAWAKGNAKESFCVPSSHKHAQFWGYAAKSNIKVLYELQNTLIRIIVGTNRAAILSHLTSPSRPIANQALFNFRTHFPSCGLCQQAPHSSYPFHIRCINQDAPSPLSTATFSRDQ